MLKGFTKFRQLLKAITHLYYGVPLENRFVIRTANMDFGRWAKLDVPIEVELELTHETTQLRGQACLNYTARARFHQEGRLTGTMCGTFSTFPQAVEDLLDDEARGNMFRHLKTRAA